jgi:hypothetical protein
MGGVDPLHPLLDCFRGTVSELNIWASKQASINGMYREICRTVPAPGAGYAKGAIGNRDPGPSVYIYTFTAGSDLTSFNCNEIIYTGITRNPKIRFQQHCKKFWWKRVTHAIVDRIDCRYHDGPLCSILDLAKSAQAIESWIISLLEPTENRALGPVT